MKLVSFSDPLVQEGALLAAQRVKNPPAKEETRVQFLGQEDPLEKGMATHCIILTGRILELLASCSLWDPKESDTTDSLGQEDKRR